MRSDEPRENATVPDHAVSLSAPVTAEVSGQGTVQHLPPRADRQHGADGVPLAWEPGDVIAELYEVRRLSEESPYAEGGMGRVNRVWHRGWQMDLAVKSVNPQYLQRPGAVEHFQREAEVWVNKLNLHPNLVFCYYVRLLGGLPRIFVEYVAGGDVASWVESGQLYEGGPEAALQRILDVAIQSAWGLHAIHTQGLVHQDVKPRNVLMTREGIAKVTDFGIARARAAAQAGETAAGLRPDVTALAGTRSYQSPEQAAGERLTLATDVWSWAISVLDLFVGGVERGFGPAAVMALEQYVTQDGQHPRRPRMPPVVVELLRRCLRCRPDDRPHSLLKIADRLRDSYEKAAGQPYPRAWTEPAEALADSLNNRALSLYDSLDRREEAEQKWQEALRIDPCHPEATYNLGLLQWREGRITDQQLLSRLGALHTSGIVSVRVDYLLGLVHLERNDGPSAIQALSRGAWRAEGAAERMAALEQAKALGSNPLAGPRRMPLAPSRPPVVSANYPLLLDHARQALAAGEAIRAAGLLAQARQEPGCARRADAMALAGQLAGFLPRRALAGGWLQQRLDGHSSEVTAVAFSSDGRFLLSGGRRDPPRVWDAATGHCLRVLDERRDGVTALAWNPDGSQVVVRSENGALLTWEVSTGRCLRSTQGPHDAVWAFAFSPNLRYGLSGAKDGVVCLWGAASGYCIRTFRSLLFGYGQQSISGGPRRPVGGLLVGCWLVGALVVFYISSFTLYTYVGHEVASALGVLLFPLCMLAPILFLNLLAGSHPDAVNAVAFSPDGRLALSGDREGGIHLWSVADGFQRRLQTWRGDSWVRSHADGVTALAFSPDGRVALSGGADRVMCLWDLSTGRCLATYEGHTDTITAVAFSPDGHYALSGSKDQTLRLWGVDRGYCLHTFEGHEDAVTAVAWSPNGCLAVSGSADNTLCLWQLDWDLEYTRPPQDA